MADAFISYAREDHDAAARLAAAFEAAGWDVWWDREILAGQSFDEVIEHELAAAKVVVVLWSAHSVGSSWVRAEATDALERGLLIPVLLSPVTQPLAFRRAQAASLVGWRGEPDHEGLASLMLSMESRLGRRRGPAAAPPAGATPAPATPGATHTPVTPPLPGTITAGAGAPAAASSGDGRAIASGTGSGGAALADRLWGSPAARRRLLIAGAVIAAVVVIVLLVVPRGNGAPIGARLAVDRPSLTLDVRSGEETSAAVVITNTGDETAEALQASVTGTRFAVNAGACASALPPGDSCEVTVRLDASASVEPETLSERLLLESGSESRVVQLSGAVTGTRAFTVTPQSLDLGEVAAGASGEVQVTNEGDTELAIDASVDSPRFTVAHDCGATLAGGRHCVVTVTVAAGEGVSRSAEAPGTLVVAVPGMPERRVALAAGTAAQGTTVTAGVGTTPEGVSPSPVAAVPTDFQIPKGPSIYISSASLVARFTIDETGEYRWNRGFTGLEYGWAVELTSGGQTYQFTTAVFGDYQATETTGSISALLAVADVYVGRVDGSRVSRLSQYSAALSAEPEGGHLVLEFTDAALLSELIDTRPARATMILWTPTETGTTVREESAVDIIYRE